MREIKFRAWDLVNETMIGLNETPQEFWSNIHPSCCDVEVMQYTGLKDKNGKEIYEGDICRAYKPNSYLDGVYAVTWNARERGWRYQGSMKPYMPGVNNAGAHCEVIGNIYEHPELMES